MSVVWRRLVCIIEPLFPNESVSTNQTVVFFQAMSKVIIRLLIYTKNVCIMHLYVNAPARSTPEAWDEPEC